MRLYPNGSNGESKGYLSLYLCAQFSEEKEQKNEFLLAVGNICRKPPLKTIEELYKGLGYPKFISHDEFFDPKNKHLQDGNLLIQCEVIICLNF
jgi:hypothetical protein